MSHNVLVDENRHVSVIRDRLLPLRADVKMQWPITFKQGVFPRERQLKVRVWSVIELTEAERAEINSTILNELSKALGAR